MDPVTSQYLTYAAFAVAGWALRHFAPGLFGGASPSAAPALPAPPAVPGDFAARLAALEAAFLKLFQASAAPPAAPKS